ncbi:hypothetical protein [Alkalihalobacillus sp. TS-13]|uniref:hypothetical protein n=1 Tax=Alkalihalobacillus sp. TS-13 TaxID=2842455 RepID=UPI001C87845D|nr:hypothetical protein [Alkalihalobacillus sp. TS-13]
MEMFIGDILFQVLAFLMLIGMITVPNFVITYMRNRKDRLKEIERKLDLLLKDKSMNE